MASETISAPVFNRLYFHLDSKQRRVNFTNNFPLLRCIWKCNQQKIVISEWHSPFKEHLGVFENMWKYIVHVRAMRALRSMERSGECHQAMGIECHMCHPTCSNKVLPRYTHGDSHSHRLYLAKESAYIYTHTKFTIG